MSNRRTAVFLGPSCTEREAKKLLPEADYYPPAARGSFYNIINDDYQTIVLIDGLFYASLSIWHKEILFALDSGIEVIGASSMGALRAAELQGTGMVGVGTIFGWYRDGIIDGDDEVALLHQGIEDDFAGLTIPLVNLRWNLRNAVDNGIIGERELELIIERAKRLCFADRTLTQILAPLKDRLDVAPLMAWLDQNSSEDLKRMDAIEALTLVGRGRSEARVPVEPRLRDYETIHMSVGIEYYWSERLNSIKAKSGDRVSQLTEYLKKVRPDDPEYRDLVRARSYQKLIVGWARELRLDSTDPSAAVDVEATWTPDIIDADHRRATGLTLPDLARENRDAKLCYGMQRQFCGEAAPDLLQELDRQLQEGARESSIDWRRMIPLDGQLIYTLWALGNWKSIAPGSIVGDKGGHKEEAGGDQPETAEAIMNFVAWIDRTGPALFGYTFDPAKEILLAYQYLNRLDAIGIVHG